MTTSRTRFNLSWLSESPEGIGSTETLSTLKFNIKDLVNAGVTPESTIEPTVKKIELSNTVYYWIEDLRGSIQLAVELTKNLDNLTVNVTGKDHLLSGKQPYADQLYHTILSDSDKPLLFSDVKLSDDGKRIWRRLVDSGKTVTIYDRKNPGASRRTITSSEELEQFWKLNDPVYQRWQYVLSESGPMTHEILGFFNTRRMRELCSLGTEDHVQGNEL
jgi:hypothetical protein